MKITKSVAAKVLKVVDAGLVSGLGVAEPGKMCVEAAVCYALDLPHGDEPSCVSPSLRALKIRLNDSAWSSPKARAKGLRRLAVAQLGSAGVLDETEFRRRVVDYALRVSTPQALRAAARIAKEPHAMKMLAAAKKLEEEPTRDNAVAARSAADEAACAAADEAACAAADAAACAARACCQGGKGQGQGAAAAAAAAADEAACAAYAARDKALAEYAEAVVQILIEIKAPGCKWLALTEAA